MFTKRDQFAIAMMKNLASFNFEDVFAEKYDFFSRIFQYLIKDYNNAGGGKYAEYYTPREIATVMARLLVGMMPSYVAFPAMTRQPEQAHYSLALAHQIGEDRCSIYSPDISEKSSRCPSEPYSQWTVRELAKYPSGVIPFLNRLIRKPTAQLRNSIMSFQIRLSN